MTKWKIKRLLNEIRSHRTLAGFDTNVTIDFSVDQISITQTDKTSASGTVRYLASPDYGSYGYWTTRFTIKDGELVEPLSFTGDINNVLDMTDMDIDAEDENDYDGYNEEEDWDD